MDTTTLNLANRIVRFQNRFSKLTIRLVVVISLIIIAVLVLAFSKKNDKTTTEADQATEPISYMSGSTDEISNPISYISQPVQNTTPIYSLRLSPNEGDDGTYAVNLINTTSLEETLITSSADSASLSTDNKLIAYLIKTDEINTGERNLYIYTISTKQSTLYLSNLGLTNSVQWSPDDKYLVLESGTYISRTYTPIEYSSKESKQWFSTSEAVSNDYNQYYWIDSNSIVFMRTSTIYDPEHKPAGSQMLNEIDKVDLTTGKKTQLAIPLVGFEYAFSGELAVAGKIKIKKISYSGPLVISNIQYFHLDLEDGTLTPAVQ